LSHQRALQIIPLSLTNYISHTSLPGLISTHLIHLVLIILFSSHHKYLVFTFTVCLFKCYTAILSILTVFLSLGFLDILPCSLDYSLASGHCLFCLFLCLSVLDCLSVYDPCLYIGLRLWIALK